MNGVRSFSPALFTLYNFSFFSLHCPYFLCAFPEKMATYSLVIDNVHFVISSLVYCLLEDFRMKKKNFPSFGPSNKFGRGKSRQIADFMLTFENF